MEFEIVTLSKQGGRAYNEDVFGHWHDDRYIACVVADGAGGHGGGDVAAAIARSSVLGDFSANPALDGEVLRRAITRANLDIVARQAEGGKLSAMRSTVVMVVVDLQTQHIAWAHSGDSRAYLFRDGALVQRTIDHSFVQQLVAGGMIDAEAARLHPQRNMLMSALGSVEEPPEVSVSDPMPLSVGDVLLLCSDGVWEPLGDERLLELLKGVRTPSQWMQAIDEQIKACAKPDQDNYTALVLAAHAEDEVTLAMPLPI